MARELLEVAIDGRPYKVAQELFTRRFLDVMREQADAGDEPTERSLNPNDLWRRTQRDWTLGSGQEFYDDLDSERERYWTSDGIDPWDKGRLKLLKDVTDISPGSGGDVREIIRVGDVIVANLTDRLGFYDGTWSFSDVADEDIRSIASDGSNIYVVVRDDGATTGGVYIASTDSSSLTLLNDLIADKVAYVSGRLMVAASAHLYNITDVSSTDAPDPLTAAEVNSEWEWDAFTSGPAFIYAAGHSGDVSLIYRISIREDGTALTAPIMASGLPHGELATSLLYYLGNVVIGTTKGLRIAQAQGGGLPYGAVVETDAPVIALEPQDRFVWYSQDGALGRIDLSRFLETRLLAAAHANDLVASVSGDVEGVVTYDDRRAFSVKAEGVFLEDTDYVSEGEFNSGRIIYGMGGDKTFVFLEVRAEVTGNDTVDVSILVDETTHALGQLTAAESQKTFDIPTIIEESPTAEHAEVILELSSDDGSTTPEVTRFTLRAQPVVSRTEEVRVPINLAETVLNKVSEEVHFDVWGELDRLQSLAREGKVVDFQEFDRSYKVTIENVQFGPELKVNEDFDSWEGICLVTVKVYAP